MSIVTFDPDIRRIERQVGRIFDDFFGDIGRRGAGGVNPGSQVSTFTGWAPRVDAYETEKEFVVNAELPGIPKEKVNVDVRDNSLIISGEHSQSEEATRGTAHYTERRYGAFTRAIPLPPNTKADDAKAKYEHGVLNITVPKSAEDQGKKITIS